MLLFLVMIVLGWSDFADVCFGLNFGVCFLGILYLVFSFVELIVLDV